jgi:hypothetical protein
MEKQFKKNKKNKIEFLVQADFIGKLRIRFRFPAILTQFLVWGQACKLCLKMRFPLNQHFQDRGPERELNF